MSISLALPMQDGVGHIFLVAVFKLQPEDSASVVPFSQVSAYSLGASYLSVLFLHLELCTRGQGENNAPGWYFLSLLHLKLDWFKSFNIGRGVKRESSVLYFNRQTCLASEASSCSLRTHDLLSGWPWGTEQISKFCLILKSLWYIIIISNFILLHIYVYICIQICACIHIYTDTYVDICVYIYIDTYIYIDKVLL